MVKPSASFDFSFGNYNDRWIGHFGGVCIFLFNQFQKGCIARTIEKIDSIHMHYEPATAISVRNMLLKMYVMRQAAMTRVYPTV
jgi:hypothetical protein